MNALTQAAKHSKSKVELQNYLIAIVCGIALGVMFGLGV
jgi:hypothetical protein